LSEVVIGFNSTRRRAAWSLRALIVAGISITKAYRIEFDTARSAESSWLSSCTLAATNMPRTHLEAEKDFDVEALKRR
jgi:hypothetical protein